MSPSVPITDYPFIFITDRHRSEGRPNLEVVRKALEGGCRWVMYREPDLDDKEFYDECLKIREMCDDVGAGLLVYDRLDIAALIRADGVHLDKVSLPLRVVKEYMGEDFLVGYSAHSVQDAVTAQWEGADYITFSPLFKLEHKESPHKPHGVKGAKEVLGKVEIPVFLLGGIRQLDIRDLMTSIRPLRIAGVSIISMAEDITTATELVLEALGVEPEQKEEEEERKNPLL